MIHKIGNHRQAPRAAIERRAAMQQRLGIRILGLLKNLLHRAGFADLAIFHHDDMLGNLAHQRQVMGDKQHRHFMLYA